MDNKYYKPDLDEFYIGFEFQNKLGDEWETEIFKDTNNLHSMYLNRDTIHLRVKYLDKEDIESLEFIHSGKSIDIWFNKKGSFNLGSWTAYSIILQYGLHDNRLRIYAEDPGMDDFVLFTGHIKNKSELIKLLKKLGI